MDDDLTDGAIERARRALDIPQTAVVAEALKDIGQELMALQTRLIAIEKCITEERASRQRVWLAAATILESRTGQGLIITGGLAIAIAIARWLGITPQEVLALISAGGAE